MDLVSACIKPLHNASNLPASYASKFPIPPWERDDCIPSLNPSNIKHLRPALRHTDKQAVMKLIREQHEYIVDPHYLRLGVMLRVFGEKETATSVEQRVVLMQVA